MDKAKTILGWFIVAVLAIHYVPVLFSRGIPMVTRTAQAFATNITSFLQF